MNDARLVGIYGGTCFLVYVETSGFTKLSALMVALPPSVLSFLALTSSMQPKARLATAGAFAFLALSRYLIFSKLSWECTILGYTLYTIGHLLYFYSFQSLIEEWSIALAMLGTMFFATLSYHCFADLYSSIPFLVLLHACSFASSCFLVVAAGSVCQSSFDPEDETAQSELNVTRFTKFYCTNAATRRTDRFTLGTTVPVERNSGFHLFEGYAKLMGAFASYVRLFGTLANVTSYTIFLLSLFGLRVEKLQIFSRLLFYGGEGLMFLANERSF